jgi:uncharacterized phosphatase
MKKLYFIRHGESVGNIKRLFTGQWDVPLTDLGTKQAKAAAQTIKERHIDLIVSSPLIRARQTAEIIAEQIGYPKEKILYSDLLKERNYGDLQQKPYSASDGIDFEDVPNIELAGHLVQRAAQAEYLRAIEADNILVVGHGTFGRALQQEILNDHSAPIEVPISQEIPNAQVVRWL